MVGPPVDFKASGPCRLLPIALPHRSDSRLYGYVMKPPEVSIKRPPQLAASNSRTPPLRLRKHTEVTCRAGFAYSHYGPTYPFQMPAAGHQCAALASGYPAGRAQCLCIRRLPGLYAASFHPQANRQTSRPGMTPPQAAYRPGHSPELLYCSAERNPPRCVIGSGTADSNA